MHGKCFESSNTIEVIISIRQRLSVDYKNLNSFLFTVTEHLEKSSCKCWLLACTVSKVLAYIPGKYNNTYNTTARTVKSSNSVMT